MGLRPSCPDWNDTANFPGSLDCRWWIYGKGTPIVGKAYLEGKEMMESGGVMEAGFDRPVQGIDSAGIKDKLYRVEEKPN